MSIESINADAGIPSAPAVPATAAAAAASSSSAAGASPGAGPPPLALREPRNVYLGRVLAYGGVVHRRTMFDTLKTRVKSTFVWQSRWIFNQFRDFGLAASERGAVPWFQGPAIGAQTYVNPWNVNSDYWPKLEECSFTPGELLVAREVRSSITQYIRRKACEPRENTGIWNRAGKSSVQGFAIGVS